MDPALPNADPSAVAELPDHTSTAPPITTSAITAQVSAVVRWLRNFRSDVVTRAPLVIRKNSLSTHQPTHRFHPVPADWIRLAKDVRPDWSLYTYAGMTKLGRP
jgi:hypothetical protein